MQTLMTSNRAGTLPVPEVSSGAGGKTTAPRGGFGELLDLVGGASSTGPTRARLEPARETSRRAERDDTSAPGDPDRLAAREEESKSSTSREAADRDGERPSRERSESPDRRDEGAGEEPETSLLDPGLETVLAPTTPDDGELLPGSLPADLEEGGDENIALLTEDFTGEIPGETPGEDELSHLPLEPTPETRPDESLEVEVETVEETESALPTAVASENSTPVLKGEASGESGQAAAGLRASASPEPLATEVEAGEVESSDSADLLTAWKDAAGGDDPQSEGEPSAELVDRLDQLARSGVRKPAAEKVESAEAGRVSSRSTEAVSSLEASGRDERTLPEVSRSTRVTRSQNETLNLNSKPEALSRELGKMIVQRLRGGDRQFRILLSPPRLGQVQVDMELREGRLDLSMKVDSLTVRHLMNSRLTELQESLASHGLSMEGFQVDVSGQEGRGDGLFDRSGLAGRRGRATDSSTRAAEADEVVEEGVYQHDGLIDTRA